MGKIISEIKKILDSAFDGEVDATMWFFGFSGIIAVREFIKSFLATPNLSLMEVVTDYIHEWLFFGITFLLVWFFLSFILKIKISRLSKVFFWAAWIVIFPPIIDMLKTGGGIFWSFYLFGSPIELWREFYSIFGNFPSGIVYFGTKIMIIVMVIMAGLMAYWHSKKLVTGVISAIGTYIIFFFMAALPAFIAFLYYYLVEGTIQIGAIEQVQLFGGTAQIFGIFFKGMKYSLAFNLNLLFFSMIFGLLVVFLWAYSKEKFIAFLKNLRFPQLIYHFGLFFVGMGLGFIAYSNNLNINLFSVSAIITLLISIFLAWEASVVINDITDLKTDKITNNSRPLCKSIFTESEYEKFGYCLLGLSLLGGLVVGFKFMIILVIYQFLAWAYSSKPYRLKRFPILATLLSATASILILFIGFSLFSGDDNIAKLSWRIIFLLLISLTLSLPIKDFKDIDGDKQDGVWTIPVIFGEEKGRLIVAVGVFISFMLSVFLLNEFKLFWWAVLFGSTLFFILINKKIKPRQFFWWALVVVGSYGLVLVKVLFL